MKVKKFLPYILKIESETGSGPGPGPKRKPEPEPNPDLGDSPISNKQVCAFYFIHYYCLFVLYKIYM